MKNETKTTHRELIQKAAEKIGTLKDARDYIDWVENRFKIRVSCSSVVKTLGPKWTRNNTNKRAAKSLAKDLLKECFQDIAVARSILDEVKSVV
tara:strand:+ start:40 stop:321 length:282 start_codon:yes stop_codon:yes gene_type:complete